MNSSNVLSRQFGVPSSAHLAHRSVLNTHRSSSASSRPPVAAHRNAASNSDRELRHTTCRAGCFVYSPSFRIPKSAFRNRLGHLLVRDARDLPDVFGDGYARVRPLPECVEQGALLVETHRSHLRYPVLQWIEPRGLQADGDRVTGRRILRRSERDAGLGTGQGYPVR